ncbi:MAG: sel1 repeat family protein, partial [Proteobacteria bacterium]|nr:sel1 repeat family protein [Pseudomonadota bacterium]
MGIGRFSSISTIIFSVSLVISANVIAGDFADQSGNVFAFQKKLAAKGNVKAQYKLGYMYEMGEGADLNLDEAKKNYKAAIESGYEPAALRLTYLEVKEKGFDKEKNADWLVSIKKMSVGSSAEALEASFLQGQLYREGIGVKKDLQKSLEIMYRLSMEGVTAADDEITKIEAETTANLKKKKAADKRRANKDAADKKQAEIARSKQQAKKEQARKAEAAAAAKAAAKPAAPAPQPAAKAAVKPATQQPAQSVTARAPAAKATKKAVAPAAAKTPEESAKSEKRKRYEAIMRKLAEEQAEINLLQGGVVDDEF